MEEGQGKSLICIERREAVALISANHGPTLKARDTERVAELSAVLAELREQDDLRVIILAGDVDFFCTGAAIEKVSPELHPQKSGIASSVKSLADLIENLGKPVIAAIRDAARGNGFDLALACTWRIASSKAILIPNSLPSRRGDFGSLVRLARIIGRAKALEVILTGQSVFAGEAKQLGVVNQVVDPPEDLMEVCKALACQISRNAPLAIKYALDAINNGASLPLANGLWLESALFGWCFATEDVREGTMAFLEKRQPDFQGK